jgi:CheY-like chemotaxis protein
MGARILIVDDNVDAAETLADLLRMLDYEVRNVGDADAAVAILDDYVPELGLLDIGLPGQDGYQLAGRLRADPRAVGMRLVALTGYGRDDDRERAMQSRFDEHLVKPVSVEGLIAVVERLLS